MKKSWHFLWSLGMYPPRFGILKKNLATLFTLRTFLALPSFVQVQHVESRNVDIKKVNTKMLKVAMSTSKKVNIKV
jgi:hypothetical protein